MPFLPSKVKVSVIISVIVFILVGCSTTKNDIDQWGDSYGGEQKIATAITDYSIPLEVRVYAVLKLVKIKKLGVLGAVLKRMKRPQQLEIVKASAPEISNMLKYPDFEVQAAAKDVLYVYMSIDQETVQKSARQTILKWYSTDFMKKYSIGHYSAFHVLTKIGSYAGDLLLELFESEKDARTKIAKIIEKINSPGLTAATSKIMLQWYNDQKPHLGKELLELASYIRDDELTASMNEYVLNKNNPPDIRLAVFNTLTYHPSVSTIPAALRIFVDKKEPIDMRGIAIEIIEKLGDDKLLDYLYPFLRDEDVKWAVFGAVLKLGGTSAVETTFKKLNPSVKFWRDDYDVARRHLQTLDKSAAESLAKFTNSKYVPIAALAIIGLQYTADKELADKILTPLTKDKRVIEYYFETKDYTIGMMASQVLSLIHNPANKTK